MVERTWMRWLMGIAVIALGIYFVIPQAGLSGDGTLDKTAGHFRSLGRLDASIDDRDRSRILPDHHTNGTQQDKQQSMAYELQPDTKTLSKYAAITRERTIPGPNGFKTRLPVYYLNPLEITARREFFMAAFRDLSPNITRVSGVYLRNIPNYDQRVIYFDKAKGLLREEDEFPNQIRQRSIGQIACTYGHMLMIYQALKDGVETALFMEDDASSSIIPYWTHTPEELIAKLPNKWLALQLAFSTHIQGWTTAFNKFEGNPFIPGHYASAAAYVLNRKGMEEVMKAMKIEVTSPGHPFPFTLVFPRPSEKYTAVNVHFNRGWERCLETDRCVIYPNLELLKYPNATPDDGYYPNTVYMATPPLFANNLKIHDTSMINGRDAGMVHQVAGINIAYAWAKYMHAKEKIVKKQQQLAGRTITINGTLFDMGRPVIELICAFNWGTKPSKFVEGNFHRYCSGGSS